MVIGGGTGGCAVAAKFSKKFDKAPHHVIVLEPNEVFFLNWKKKFFLEIEISL